MDYITLPLPLRPMTDPETVPVVSLYEALQKLPDPRRAQGKRYELALIVCLVVLAKLAGQKTLSGATEWIRQRSSALAQRFGVCREKMPCQMTYCNVLSKIDAKQLDAILAAFFVRWEAQSRCGEEPSRLQTPQRSADHAHLAIDGKTLRATTAQPHPVHQLSCYEVATGIVLWHYTVQENQHEISALKPLLRGEVVKGRIDAAWMRCIPNGTCARKCIGLKGTMCLLPRTTSRVSERTSLICLQITRPIVVAGRRLRPGTKGMGAWSIARSYAVLISMTGLGNSGKALNRSFGWNERRAP